ncbi:MAG: hypothetical protein Q8N99_07845 [Nanoarchaeota archaeon]|nr:hypothetical protein [Nanoarchaeota archaeon]
MKPKMGNETPVETKIVNYIEKFGRPIEWKAIVKAIVNNKKIGHSKTVVGRRIQSLVKTGELRKLSKEEILQWKINIDHERASYYITTKISKAKEHLDNVLLKVNNKTSISEIRLILSEIFHYNYYNLSSKQLDTLVDFLKRSNLEIISLSLILLYEHINKRKIEPSKDKINELKTELNRILKMYPEKGTEQKNFRSYAISLLAYYKDSTILEQFKEDIKNCDMSVQGEESFLNRYNQKYLLDLIYESGSELYEIQKSLIKNGKKKKSDLIQKLRDRVKERMEGIKQ